MSKKMLRVHRALSMLLVIVMVMALLAPSSLAAYQSSWLSDDSEPEYICNLDEHQHDESCYAYDLIWQCRVDFEESREFFWDESDPGAVKFQQVVHEEHDDSCYDLDGNLICYLDEIKRHVHDETCYEFIGVLPEPEPEPEIPEIPGVTEIPEEIPEDIFDGSENQDVLEPSELDVLALAMPDYTSDDWRLICGQEDMTDWTEHYHCERCSYQDEVLICELQEHAHSDACVDSSESVEPEASVVSDEDVQAFVEAVNQFILDIDAGVYADDRAGFDAASAHIDDLKAAFIGCALSETQVTQIEFFIAKLNDAKVRYYESENASKFDASGFIVSIDKLILDMKSGVYDSDSVGFQEACLSIDTLRQEYVDAVLDDSVRQLVDAKLVEYDQAKSDYVAIAASEQVLVKYIDLIDKLFETVESMPEDAPIDREYLKKAFAEIDAQQVKIAALYMTDSQCARFTEISDKYALLKSALSEDMLEMEAVTFNPRVNNRVVAVNSSERFVFQISRASVQDDGTSVLMPDVAFAYCNDAGEAVFDAITFKAAGTYDFNIAVKSGSGVYRYDARTWQLRVVIIENAGVLQIQSAVYSLLGSSTTRTDCADFIQVGIARSSWDSKTLNLAQRVMDTMTLEEKVGQLILMHYPGDGAGTVSAAVDLIDKYHLGGYLVFAAMFQNSNPTDVRAKIADTQAASKWPMLFTVDEEGGKVTRISQFPAFRSTKFVGPQDLKAQGGLSAVRSDTLDKVTFLRDLGLNVNHAPDCDTADASGYVYARTYGGDGVENAGYAETYVSASNSKFFGSTMKHFPGYGSTSSDTHAGFAVNHLTKQDFYYNDLLPFYAGVAAGGRGMMVTHNIVEAWDSVNPASLSPAIYNLLRDELGFDGVVMTDDLGMGAIQQHVGTNQECLAALKAGADIAMTAKTSAIDVVFAAAESGKLSVREIEEKCLRVLAWKVEMGLIDESMLDEGETPDIPADYEAVYINQAGTRVEYGTFDEMMALAVASNGTVKLAKDCDSRTEYSISGDVIIDLAGFDLTYLGVNKFIIVNAGGNFTLNDTVGQITDVELPKLTDPTGYNSATYQLYYNKFTVVGGTDVETSRHADFSQVGRLYADRANALLWMNGGTLNIQNGVIENPNGPRAVGSVQYWSNVINFSGGAVVNSGVLGMGAAGNGAGIYLHDGYITMSGGYVVGNRSGRVAGGIYLYGSAWGDFQSGVIAYNDGYINGGGLYAVTGKSFIKNAIFTGNYTSFPDGSSNGGNIYTTCNLDITDNANISYGRSSNGAGIFAWKATAKLYMKDKVVIAKNHASHTGGGIAMGYEASPAGSELVLFDEVFVIDNTADVQAGGIYVDKTLGGIAIHRMPHVKNNFVGDKPYNLFLPTGMKMHITRTETTYGKVGTVPGCEIHVYSESEAGKIPVCDNTITGVNITSENLAHFIPDRDGYVSALIDSEVYFVQSEDVSIDAMLLLDNVPYKVGTFSSVWSSVLGGKYVVLDNVASNLTQFGFDLSKYAGEYLVGVQAGDSDVIQVADKKPVNLNGVWQEYLPDGVDLSNSKIWIMPNLTQAGEYALTDLRNHSYYSVRVNDVYGTTQSGVEDVSAVYYVAAGSDMNLTLPYRDGVYAWAVNPHDEVDFECEILTQTDSVDVALHHIFAPVVLVSGEAGDVRYTVQYYAYAKTLNFADIATGNTLPVIDTTNGRGTPKLGAKEGTGPNDLKVKYLVVESDGRIAQTTSVAKIYADNYYVYSAAPTLLQVDRLYTDNHYRANELWVLKSGHNPESTNPEDWDVYNSDALGLKTIHDLHLTNSPDFAVLNDTICIENDAVIRFVYTPTDGMQNSPVMFYDYDITDGHVYSSDADAQAGVNPKATSTQDSLTQAWASTLKKGINSPSNYTTGSGAHFAFGNGNTGSGWDTESYSGSTLNKYDHGRETYQGCTFEIVSGLDADGNLIYSKGVMPLKLFNDGDAIGKTAIDGHELVFERYGDNYTFSSVTGTNATNLTTFGHPATGDKVYTTIWTNDFWPADAFETYGADGHDLKHGDYTKLENRKFRGSIAGSYPSSDDGLDHNAFFGMHFTVDFALPAGYSGALEYCFFGDDDMWVFLDDKLVLDIGGVHRSVGEYVNLWDYIEPGDTSKHKLSLYYTERGESGSTCWMHFTIPSAHFDSETWESQNGSLQLMKTVNNSSDLNATYVFDIEILDADGNAVQDDYSYVLHGMNGANAQYGVLTHGVGTLGLVAGQMLSLPHLPGGYQYRITENEYSCQTSYVLNHDSENLVESREISGVITAGSTEYIECVNDFEGHMFLPSTGSNSHMIFSVACYFIVVLCLIGLVILHRRKVRYQGKHIA